MPDKLPLADEEQASKAALDTVLVCLRAWLDNGALQHVAEDSKAGAPDWLAVRDLALVERVATFLYQVVGRRQLLPSAVEQLWREEYHRTAIENALLRRQLETVLSALEAAEVPVVLLKGAAMCATLYGWDGLRPTTDADLLLHREDLSRAVRVLAEFGYDLAVREPRVGTVLRFENAVVLIGRRSVDPVIDLHWSLFDSPRLQRLSLGWFWDTAVRCPVGGTTARVLSPEAQLLHHCGHLVLHHRGRGLLWYHDIATLLHRRGRDLDWELIRQVAAQMGLALPVRTVIPRVASDWQLSLPASALEAIERLEVSDAERQTYAAVVGSRSTVGRRFLSDLQGMPNWRERWRFAIANLFPSPAYMRQRYGYPSPLWLPLLYLYRWWLGLRSLVR